MGEWLECTLGEIAEINPTEKLSKGISAKKIPMEALEPFTKKIPWYQVEKYAGGVKFRNGDTLIARITPSLENGKTSYVDILEDYETGFGSTEFIVLREIENISNKHFLYYLALSPDFREVAIQSMTGSSGRQRVQNDVVFNHVFLIPSIEEQKAIAEVLSSLDDKIDLLHRQNKTLEELAQTLFRQWFVEEAKEEWEVVILSDVMELKYGKDHKLLSDGNIPVYGSGGIMRYADKFLYDKESILIPRKGTLTNIFYIDEPFWTVDTIFWSKINSEKVSVKFLFSFLKTMDLSILNVGSAVPSLTTKVLNEIKISLPSIDEQKDFNEYVDNAWNKIKSNNIQIKTLENMRDTLLPKLMSGEVRVENE